MQRTGQAAAGPGEQSAPAEEAGRDDDRGAAVIARLSRSIERHTVQQKMKTNIFAPGTWWPEHWMAEGPARLRKTLDRRVLRGEPFNDQEMADIRHLSAVNPEWLREVGIGTHEEAEEYTRGQFKDWLKLPAGKRVLTATIALRTNHPDVRAVGEAPPTSPDYTLGRFMTTQAPGVSPEDKRVLGEERDEQIRQTAIATLYPAGIPAERMHPRADENVTEAHRRKDASARELLTNVLLVLRHGLQLYDAGRKAHVADHGKDVIRALAHGGRVTIRIPALGEGESPTALTDFLGVTRPKEGKPGESELGEHVERRGFATHRVSIEPNTADKRGKFKEKGEIPASLTNALAPPVRGLGPDRPALLGHDISGGGLGAKDWNGDVILPNGSHGHMLLVFHEPTRKKDGALMVGIETIGPGAASPVGYTHDFRSSEATANPESVLHGHKGDKIGEGSLGQNQRLVDLQEVGSRHDSGSWLTFLNAIKEEWVADLAQAEEQGAPQAEELYRKLVGPRSQR
ncbi:PE-PGRS family protein [Streptomyces albus]|uniref:PE-PGRS family protein n=1 Tax=Streptomyces albus TaxID=1888 RepID=UPI001FC9BBD9|nr:PE-PGRS family protein [Streptomyces albus]